MRRLTILSLAVLTAMAGPALGGPLGVAGDYAEFILGNANQANSDIQGKIAVGGNLTFNGMSVAALEALNTTNVVVGGNLTATNGTIRGNSIVGGNVNYNNPTIQGNIAANGSVTFNPSGGGSITGSVKYGTTFTKPSYMTPPATQGSTTVPINFTQEALFLKALSQAQVRANDPTAIFQYSQSFFNGGAGLNVFNISEAAFEASTGGFNFNAPQGATIVVNVPGTDIQVLNTGFNFTGGVTVDHVIWNFYEATSITLAGSSVGSFLAPKATVKGAYGGFNGTLIAAAFNGYNVMDATSVETHTKLNGNGENTLFAGVLRAVGVPEPASLALFGGGLLALGLRRRRRAA